MKRLKLQEFQQKFLCSGSWLPCSVYVPAFKSIIEYRMGEFVAIPLKFSSFLRKAIIVIIHRFRQKTNLNVKLFGCFCQDSIELKVLAQNWPELKLEHLPFSSCTSYINSVHFDAYCQIFIECASNHES